MSFALVLCLVGILSTLLFTVHGNTSKGDELYSSIKREKRLMMFKVSFSMSAREKKCRDSCVEGASDRKEKENECHCDKHCVDFGDCCLDYWESCNSSLILAYNKDQIFQCIRPTLYLSSNTSIKENPRKLGFQVATKCPPTFKNLKAKNSCESPEERNENVLPFVQGIDGRTYRNKFCAECSGVFKYTRWNTELECSNGTRQFLKRKLREKDYKFTIGERKQIRESCTIRMEAPNETNSVSCRIVTECQNTQSPDYLKCKLYKLQIYEMIKPYKPFKNPHCARCNGMFLGILTVTDFSLGDPDFNKYSSLGMLFDFTKGSQIYGLKEVTTKHTCKPGEIYDFSLKLCRQKRVLKTPKFLNWTCAYFNETFPNSSEFLKIFDNQSIYVISHDKLYSPGEYLWHEENVTVCGNLTVIYLKTMMQRLGKLYSKAEYFITIVGLSLSILALLIVIATYLLFSELRSKLPGKIVINLAIALMLAQLVFLVDMFSDVNGKGCVAIAVFLQFLYLAAFCWMNVMAFDVSRTFAGKSHRSPSGSRNRVFLLSLIYAWGLPLVITGLTLIIDHSGAMDVSYGNNYYCWITNPIAMVVFFVIPVVLMLLFNIIALVRVLVAVRRVRKVTKKVRDKSTTGQDARMCWKLTAVFGLTWILCLAAEHHIALRIVYIIFNSLQGVFIMVGFILTKRVLNMYLKKAGKEPLTTTTASTQKSTISRSEVTRQTSTAPLVNRKSSEKKHSPKCEKKVEVVKNEDSPEARLISSMEGQETKL